ncbi:hypothetical protein EZJ19_07110 [Parasulfuritortus cantonensis]|uniref:Uncharacterized protein n=1 Tax=Parasulfuritortus cantonensis TaxID=2528202 RepID=A0A4R1BED3_9PROT|nr:hypothetical protein [Parasulfuritortus cantonensis]TCJ15378.1 hypothetical protein EZJ19_07110 [Parasulfuritortus cantonensis]
MHHFYDSASREDVYLSDDKPTRGLIKMRCMDNSQHQFPHPMCRVESDYQPNPEQNMGKSDSTTVLLLQYFFSIEYAPDLRTIDQNLKQLFDGFIDAAPRDLTMLDMGRFCQANEAGMLAAWRTVALVWKPIRGA